MNPTEIADALEEISQAPFEAAEFPFVFAEATGNAKATISKLRSGTYNKSKVVGGVLMNRKFYSLTTASGEVASGLTTLRTDKKTVTHKPAILIVTDGDDVSAEHLVSGDTLHCKFSDLHHHFGFFLPAAGMSRYEAAEENEVDVKAVGKLAKLYDALLKKNPDWKTAERRHELNQFMTRLIFCMFAEDVGIFSKDQFSRLIFTHAGDGGVEAHVAVIQAFTAMKLPENKRDGLAAWTNELRYVNGGLFAGEIDCPIFDRTGYRYLQEACRLDWREINPDIFGSMIQAVADPEKRSKLGMHYTSVPNILKVLEPLFLVSLDSDIEKVWGHPAGLQRVLERIANIRVFDPACGSGNFLVVAYRELRTREMRVLERMGGLTGDKQVEMWSKVNLSSFYGIEITDFGAKTAKLSLFIADYQANSRFGDMFGTTAPALPLRDGGNVVCDNALRINWEIVCPPPEGDEEIYIAGNPPWVWSNDQTAEQKFDMGVVFQKKIKAFKSLDYVSAWVLKLVEYAVAHSSRGAFVATNSISQGQSVPMLWPYLLSLGAEISFAHTTFKWSNNAADNATVDAVVIGLASQEKIKKRLFVGEYMSLCDHISPYLLPNIDVIIEKQSSTIFGLPTMDYGSKPIDGGFLILSESEAISLIEKYPSAKKYLKRLYGSDELIYDKMRFCLFISDEELHSAKQIPEINRRINAVRVKRLESPDSGAQKAADRSHQFREHREPDNGAIYLPAVSSENRLYLTPIFVGIDSECTNRNFVLYDPPTWALAVLSSSLHRVWTLTVCGKLQKRPNYSNTLGWNTFPVPKFTNDQLDQLNNSARAILKTRYLHHPKTIAQLYDPNKMPDDLREVHRQNDELLETMYIGRLFKNDTERLERLFKLYAARVEKMKKEVA